MHVECIFFFEEDGLLQLQNKDTIFFIDECQPPEGFCFLAHGSLTHTILSNLDVKVIDGDEEGGGGGFELARLLTPH